MELRLKSSPNHRARVNNVAVPTRPMSNQPSKRKSYYFSPALHFRSYPPSLHLVPYTAQQFYDIIRSC
jgi:hypothetical protein